MVAQIKCTSCSGIFGPSMFENKDERVCRFCHIRVTMIKERDQLNGKLESLSSTCAQLNGKVESLSTECVQLREGLKKATDKINSLENKSETLQEFVTLNIAGASANPTDLTSTNGILQAPARTEHEFQVVRNNVQPKARKVIPTTCQNRFQILTDQTGEEEEEVRLVGDSLVRGQLTELCARAPEKRKLFCIPGAGVEDVIASLDEVSNLAPANTTYVVHVGSNDVLNTRSEELMSKYKRLIRSFKDKSRNVIISGIIPRVSANQQFFNFASSTNRRLSNLCREEDIGFIDTWDHFYYDHSLFTRDGVHLNQVGAARFGRLLNDAVQEYAKNGGVRAPRDA